MIREQREKTDPGSADYWRRTRPPDSWGEQKEAQCEECFVADDETGCSRSCLENQFGKRMATLRG
ncbi:MAG: hypothetical protein AAF514_23275, partial [Verrucomicrobiota bacterium]